MMTNALDLNLPWRNSNFIVLDLEGTGAQHKEREGIVEIAAIPIKNKQLTSNYYYKLINPKIDIPPMISRIHGLKNKDVWLLLSGFEFILHKSASILSDAPSANFSSSIFRKSIPVA